MADRQAVVLYDAIRFTDADGNVQEALKDAEVSLPAEEFDRLAGFKGREGNPEPAVEAPSLRSRAARKTSSARKTRTTRRKSASSASADKTPAKDES
jgi:hypothetical protein